MAAALKRFYKGDDETWKREMSVFRSCNEKLGKLLNWSNDNNGSIDELRSLALSRGGLYNASIRRKAWPVLMGTQCGNDPISGYSSTRDLDLMKRDVQRSALFRSRAVAGSVVRGEQRFEELQNKLLTVLDTALCTSSSVDDKPCYYQGLHDVAFVLMFNLNCDEVATTAALQKLLMTHLKDASRKDFSNVTFVLDSFLMPLLHSLDPEIYQALLDSDVPLTNAILPWVITLFTHSVHDGAVASRLMDAFLAESDPMLPFYLAVALLLHPALRHQLLEAAYDPVMMHLAIHGLPGQIKNDFAEGEEAVVTAQDIIELARKIMHQRPPESLLRSLGDGLSKRSRRRLFNKARRIHMLPDASHFSSWKASAQRFLQEYAELPRKVVSDMRSVFSNATSKAQASLDKVQARTDALYEVAKINMYNERKTILSALQVLALLTLMPQSLSIVQILALFVLIPRDIVTQCFFSLQTIVCAIDERKIIEERSLCDRRKGERMVEEDVPDMIRSPSTVSLSGLKDDLSSSELSYDLDDSFHC